MVLESAFVDYSCGTVTVGDHEAYYGSFSPPSDVPIWSQYCRRLG